MKSQFRRELEQEQEFRLEQLISLSHEADPSPSTGSRTHTTWYAVAPRVVDAGFSVVCPDLRGYGRSGKPTTDADHTPYSKRAMAADVVGLMERLGHRRFMVAGHDRGSYVTAGQKPCRKRQIRWPCGSRMTRTPSGWG